jgi:hypothetical protein
MARRDVTRIFYFEIISDESRAVYGKHYAEPAKGDEVERIRRASVDGRLPGVHGSHAASSAGSRFLLDIPVASDEMCAFAFRLNALVGDTQRLLFAESGPFVGLPLNSSSDGEFLAEFRTYEGEPRQWASLVCDLQAVRRSRLADQIRKLSAEHGEAPLMKIPFWLNLVDPELGASPWAVPIDEPDELHRNLLTHGGPHPLAPANIVVEL